MQTIPGPSRTPLPYGLFSVLTPSASPDRWRFDGAQWEGLTCEPATGLPAACLTDPPEIDPEEPEGGVLISTAVPFTVIGSFVCSLVGFTPEEAQERATLHLLAREEQRAEQAIWTGDLGNAGFAANAVNAGSATALSLRRAVAALDAAISQAYGSLGVLHMTRETALLAIAVDVVTVKGNALQTALGTPVIAGAGYPGTGPAGEDPSEGETYIYATPPLVGLRSEIDALTQPASAGFDPSNNDFRASVHRDYLVGWDECDVYYAVASLPA